MHLFSPFDLRGVRLRNRIAVSPMCQYSSVDGYANDWHMVHLGSRAVGGAGLVFTEATAVSPEGRISPEDLGIWDESHCVRLTEIAGFISQQGAIPGIQLAHAGRKASTLSPWKGNGTAGYDAGGWPDKVIAPSAQRFADDYPNPRQITLEEIPALIAEFSNASRRALECGFQVIELHAAHGYLLHEFLSPLSNHRTDQYGGDFDNRIRLLCEIVEAVRKVWPDNLPLFTRVSATDWTAGGWTPDETVELAGRLQSLGVDLLDCSSGGNVPTAPIPIGPGYQIPFARRIRTETSMASGGVGMITSAEQADQIIRNGDADLVLLAREMLRDPYWALHAARALKFDQAGPNQYLRAI